MTGADVLHVLAVMALFAGLLLGTLAIIAVCVVVIGTTVKLLDRFRCWVTR